MTWARVVVQKPDTAPTIPVAAENVFLAVPLPVDGGARAVRFAPPTPGRYLVVFEARSHPPSDCDALRGQRPPGWSPPSAARPSSVAPTPATWADQDTDNGLGIIVVR